MSSPADIARGPARACHECMRRSWLLAELSPLLDFQANDLPRLMELLSLEDGELMKAMAGRRVAELNARHASLRPEELAREPHVEAICRHDPRYPRGLRNPAAPRMLHVRGGAAALAELAAAPVVAIVGTRRASDYGVEMAKSLARGLAASRVTVTSSLGDGISAAAHAGALEVGGRTIAVAGDGLGLARSGRRRATYERVTRRGCAASELPSDRGGRRWGQTAGQRIVTGLAQLVVVVEATDAPHELAVARIARALGRVLAAVPGRVTSQQSSGANALLMDGARMVREPRDALDLLYPIAEAQAAYAPDNACSAELTPRLRRTLEMVGAGRDTPERLARDGAALEDVLLTLSELELMGLLARGDGGRYVPRGAFTCSPSHTP
jgi:DNA processing protein